MMLFTVVSVMALLGLSKTAPVNEMKRDVWDPKVLYPHAGTVWKVGQEHNVTWDKSDAPKQITNSIGMVVLAKGYAELDTNNPLASGFNLTDGRVEITVPDVEPGTYDLVLFGDSGNISQNFTIED